MKKTLTYLASFLIITIPDFVSAQVRPINEIFQRGIIPDPTGVNNTFEIADIFVLLGNVLTLLFTFTAIIAMIYIIIGGYTYVTAYGNPESVQKGKQTITWAILGLIISSAAWTIVQFVWETVGSGAQPSP